MIKRWFLVAWVLLLVPLLMAGCGVSQEEFDSVLAERDAGQGQIASLQGDLDLSRAQTKTLESDLSALQSQVKTLQGNYEVQKTKMAKAAAYTGAWHIYLYPIRKNAGIAQKLSFASDT